MDMKYLYQHFKFQNRQFWNGSIPPGNPATYVSHPMWRVSFPLAELPVVKLSADVHLSGRRHRRHRAHEERVAAHAGRGRRVVVVERKLALLTSIL
jgi:hypothetical protein